MSLLNFFPFNIKNPQNKLLQKIGRNNKDNYHPKTPAKITISQGDELQFELDNGKGNLHKAISLIDVDRRLVITNGDNYDNIMYNVAYYDIGSDVVEVGSIIHFRINHLQSIIILQLYNNVEVECNDRTIECSQIDVSSLNDLHFIKPRNIYNGLDSNLEIIGPASKHNNTRFNVSLDSDEYLSGSPVYSERYGLVGHLIRPKVCKNLSGYKIHNATEAILELNQNALATYIHNLGKGKTKLNFKP